MDDTQRMHALLLDTVDAQKLQMAQMARMLEIQRQQHDAAHAQLMQVRGLIVEGIHGLGNGGQRLATDVMTHLERHGRQAFAQALGQPLEEARLGIRNTAQMAAASGQAAARQLGGLSRSQHAATRLSLLWLVIGGLFLVVGVSIWSWQTGREALRNRVEADLGSRLGRADIVKCGSGLCANVDARGRGLGDQHQYRPIKPRGNSDSQAP